MSKRIAAVAFIWLCTTIAWCFLGGTIFSRTYSSDEKLQSKIASTWGTKQEQSPPTALFSKTEDKKTEIVIGDKTTERIEHLTQTYLLPLASTRVDVDLNLDHRQKGLLWYSTYAVKFAGEYSFANNSGADQLVTFRLPFPAQQAIYDNLLMEVDGHPLTMSSDTSGAFGQAQIKTGQTAVLRVGYGSQGMDSW